MASQSPAATDENSSLCSGEDAATRYMRQISSLPRLTPEEELYYAKQFDDARNCICDLVCQFPTIVCQSLDNLLTQTDYHALVRQLEIREFEDREAITTQLGSTLQEANNLKDQIADLVAKSEPEARATLSSARSQLRELIQSLPLKEAFFKNCSNLFQDFKNLAENGSEQNASQHGLLISQKDFEVICKKINTHQAQQDDAQRSLVEGNLRLVISIVRKYLNCGLPFLDLIQEGNIGLFKAIEKYDYRLGHRFSTYSSFWIKRAITKALTQNSRTIRLPANMVAILRRIADAEKKLLQTLGQEPTPEEIAQELSLPVARVRALRKMSAQMISIQGPVQSESSTMNMGDIIEDDNAPLPDESADVHFLKEAIKDAINTLKDREKDVLTLHYGLNGDPPVTLEEIAVRYNLTGERIRQIKIDALKRLRHPTRRKYFDGHQ